MTFVDLRPQHAPPTAAPFFNSSPVRRDSSQHEFVKKAPVSVVPRFHSAAFDRHERRSYENIKAPSTVPSFSSLEVRPAIRAPVVKQNGGSALERVQSYVSGLTPLEKLDQIDDFLSMKGAQHVGSGSLGDVVKAVDIWTQQPLAVKMISRKAITDAGVAEERLRREVHVMSKLNHANIVKLVDVFGCWNRLPGLTKDPPYLCIVMNLVENGASLSSLIARNGGQPELALIGLPQLASALNHIHAQGIVHRDVWSENVLINPERHMFLCDFGCAEYTLGAATFDRLNIPYLSPQTSQCIRQHPTDDSWALGLMTTEMVTGKFVRDRLGRTDIPIHDAPHLVSAAIAETFKLAGPQIGLIAGGLLNLQADRRWSMQRVVSQMQPETNGSEPRAVAPTPGARLRSLTPSKRTQAQLGSSASASMLDLKSNGRVMAASQRDVSLERRMSREEPIWRSAQRPGSISPRRPSAATHSQKLSSSLQAALSESSGSKSFGRGLVLTPTKNESGIASAASPATSSQAQAEQRAVSRPRTRSGSGTWGVESAPVPSRTAPTPTAPAQRVTRQASASLQFSAMLPTPVPVRVVPTINGQQMSGMQQLNGSQTLNMQQLIGSQQPSNVPSQSNITALNDAVMQALGSDPIQSRPVTPLRQQRTTVPLGEVRGRSSHDGRCHTPLRTPVQSARQCPDAVNLQPPMRALSVQAVEAAPMMQFSYPPAMWSTDSMTNLQLSHMSESVQGRQSPQVRSRSSQPVAPQHGFPPAFAHSGPLLSERSHHSNSLSAFAGLANVPASEQPHPPQQLRTHSPMRGATGNGQIQPPSIVSLGPVVSPHFAQQVSAGSTSQIRTPTKGSAPQLLQATPTAFVGRPHGSPATVAAADATEVPPGGVFDSHHMARSQKVVDRLGKLVRKVETALSELGM